MDELLNELFEAVLNPKNNVEVKKDDNGDLIIRISKPKENSEIKQIRQEIEDMDDDVFEEAATLLKKVCPSDFEVLQTLENKYPNVNNIKNSYKVFQSCVDKVLNSKINNYQSNIIEYQNKIKEYKQEIAKLRK